MATNTIQMPYIGIIKSETKCKILNKNNINKKKMARSSYGPIDALYRNN